jgi:hypothetical protein
MEFFGVTNCDSIGIYKTYGVLSRKSYPTKVRDISNRIGLKPNSKAKTLL